MKKIILFNGPPRAGKDTLVNAIHTEFPFTRREKFVAPLKKMMEAVYGDWNEDLKDEPVYFGYTGRQILIKFCEEFLKPLHGRDIVGKLTMRRLEQYPEDSVILFSDLGFIEEALPIINKYETYLVRIHRPGFDFSKDSRSYLTLDCPTYDLHNLSLLDYIAEGMQLFRRIINDTATSVV